MKVDYKTWISDEEVFDAYLQEVYTELESNQ